MARRDQIIDETIDRFPNVGNRTLARLLVEQYPDLYTIESARTAIRYRFGANGKKSQRSTGKKEHKEHCTLDLPPGISDVKKPVRFMSDAKWGILSDIHIPYHNEIAVDAAIKKLVDSKVPNLYLNGDCVDFHKISDFVSDPRSTSPNDELKILKRFLKSIKKYFKGHLIYKIGNHEVRYERYLYGRASAVVGIEEFELERVLGLKEIGFRCVYSKQHSVLGDLNVFHGHELPKGMGSPVNPAKSLYVRINDNGVVGHHHYMSSHVATNAMTKRSHQTFSTGCLCQLVKDYSSVNNWNHGFGIAVVQERKTQFRNLLIDRGKVCET